MGDQPPNDERHETDAMEAWVVETLAWSSGLRLGVSQTTSLALSSRALAARLVTPLIGAVDPRPRAELGVLLELLANDLDLQARDQEARLDSVHAATTALQSL